MTTTIDHHERVAMKVQEPSAMEVYLTVIIGNLLSRFWKAYIDRLPLKGDERMLELGPSAGNATRHLAKCLLKGGGRLTCVDISSRWLEVARKRLAKYPNIAYRLGDIGALDLPDEAYDAALISFVLHDIPAYDRQRVMRQVAAKLVPGGQMYIREPLRFLSQEEICRVTQASGLTEMHWSVTNVRTQGQVYEGIFCRREDG
jgi:ubiquinone/menaquinone biosynthesis C-methylase UbiE